MRGEVAAAPAHAVGSSGRSPIKHRALPARLDLRQQFGGALQFGQRQSSSRSPRVKKKSANRSSVRARGWQFGLRGKLLQLLEREDQPHHQIVAPGPPRLRPHDALPARWGSASAKRERTFEILAELVMEIGVARMLGQRQAQQALVAARPWPRARMIEITVVADHQRQLLARQRALAGCSWMRPS